MSTAKSNPKDTPQRWHDRRPELSQSVKMMSALPYELQSIIADGVIKLAEKEFDANELMHSFKSLGTEKVLGLYKSKNKRRAYDKNPTLHKAVTYLYVLSEENQDFMAKQILELGDQYFQYFSSCKTYQVTPDSKDVTNITHLFVKNGSREAQRFLKEIRTKFEQNLDAIQGRRLETLKDGTHGMRLSGGKLD